MSREYPDRPIVGAGAVILDQGRVLLVKRAVPGGMVELGETVRAATEREALEETGLAVKVGEVLDVFDGITPGKNGLPQYHYVLVDFLCERVGGELRAGGDAADVAWVREDELAKYQVEGLTLAVVRKAFSLSRSRT